VTGVLVDTNAYVAFKRGAPDALEVVRLAERLGLSVVVLGELLAGFALGSRESDNRRELAGFLDSPRASVLPVGEATAEFYARVYRGLRRKGTPIPTNDLWIAATALEHGLAIFTYERHFEAVDGLIVSRTGADFLP